MSISIVILTLRTPFSGLMNEHRISDIRRMFMLFERVGRLDSLKDGVSLYVRKTGESLVGDNAREKSLIEV